MSEEPTTTTSSTSTTTSTTSTTSTTQPVGPLMPLTGLSSADANPEAGALVVKIGNNNGQSRPQMGLIEADIVYEELIEGSKTRFAAIYHSTLPIEVGPVRSGRTSDIDLFDGLGMPALGFSGGNSVVLGAIRSAANRDEIVDVGAIWRESYYYRVDDRSAPYNLWFSPFDDDGEEREIRGLTTPGPQFVYGTLDESVGQPIGGVSVNYPPSFSGRESVHIWDEAVGGWVRVQDGTLHTGLLDGEETEIAPANVVVALIPYGVSPADPASPEAESFGMGGVQVFTQGREVQGQWIRSEENPVWDLRTVGGDPIPLAPGATWVLLVANSASRFASGDITTYSQTDAAVILRDARDLLTLEAN
jgi:hypothetical protein